GNFRIPLRGMRKGLASSHHPIPGGRLLFLTSTGAMTRHTGGEAEDKTKYFCVKSRNGRGKCRNLSRTFFRGEFYLIENKDIISLERIVLIPLTEGDCRWGYSKPPLDSRRSKDQ
ncbi:MAG: hypothetical protein JXR29_09065, partial [Methylothermaceae bacterium]|nr:hypothetical protein [Methylothermaceae bacterium]